MDANPYPLQGIPRYPTHPHHQHNDRNYQHSPPPPSAAFYPSIDVDALAAGVQRYLPGRPPAPPGYPHGNNSYIHLPPGVDPATVDFRTFYPYNPSEVKHRKRTTRPQLKVLEETFKRETKPNAALRKQLAAQLEMTPRGVQVWFQNRRAKEKNLAKKASNANGKKPINQDGQKSDGSASNSKFDATDGDADLDDGDVDIDPSASGTADDDAKSNGEQPARPASQAPGTAAFALDDRNRSHSSSNSPESASPELSPPNGASPHVDASPPTEDERNPRLPEAKHGADVSGLGFPPSSWQGPPRSMSRTPTSVMSVEQGQGYPGEIGYGDNMQPAHDQFMRRTSLPTHIGIGPSRVRAGYSPRLHSMALSPGRMPGFDPGARRMSLDRLATHPYAHVAAQANSMAYGSNLSRYRPTLPATTHSTPTLTPQARTIDLPPINQMQIEAAQSGNGNDDGGSHASIGMAELSLPPHMHQHHHPSLSPPAPEMRPELMHRQSLPAPLATTSNQYPPDSTASNYLPPPQSANPVSTRFPRPGHMYTLSTRNYRPPIPGPLPNPDFSFGTTVDNVEGEGVASVDGANTPDMQLQSQLNSFQFPAMEDGKDSAGSSAPTSNGMDMEMVDDSHPSLPSGGLGPRPHLYYRDTHGIHGTVDPYTSRFGSIASTASVAESESSVTSGACFSSESASNFEIRHEMPNGYNDGRRPSCTSSMMNMFSNLDMRNNSHSSLPQRQEAHKPQDPHQHPLQQHGQQQPHPVTISRSSELALALLPENENTSVYGGDNGSSVNVNMSEAANDAGIYARGSMSSSDLSHHSHHSHSHLHASGHGHGTLHGHPLAAGSSRSTHSSRSSLGIGFRPRIETENLDFMHNYDAVSETGHYSPVLSPAPFEYPLREPGSSGVQSAQGSVTSLPESAGMMGRTPPHQYGGVDGQQQQPQTHYYNTSGPFSRDGNYVPQPSPSHSLYGHSQESLSGGYGYYN